MKTALETKATRTSLHRGDIQALRGVAVVAVVLFHSFSSVFPNGYLGVDLFFVISGFVMTPQILDIFRKGEDFEPRLFAKIQYFYLRRFYRLAPAFGVSMLFATAVILLFGNLADHGRFTMQGIYSFFLIGNVGALRFNGNYFNSNFNPLTHLWSLSAEEQIYVLIPILLLILVTICRVRNLPQALFKKYAVALTGFFSIIYYFPEITSSFLIFSQLTQFAWIFTEPFSYYSPLHRVLEFLLGAIAAATVMKSSVLRFWNAKRVRLLAAIVLLAVLFFPNIFSLNEKCLEFIVCLSGVILLLIPSNSTRVSNVFSPLCWAGDRSYSLYLYHLPLLYIVQIGFFSRVNIPLIVMTVLAVSIATLMAHVTYRFIEQPNKLTARVQKVNHPINVGFFKSFGIYFLVPLILLGSMNIANSYNYFGLNRNLKPPLSAATLDSQCQRDSLSGGPCIYPGVKASKSVLLIGDSHAAMFSQMVVDEARKANWNAIVWAHNGYSPRLHDTSDLTSNPSSNLAVLNTLAQIRWIEKYQPDLVIVSAAMVSPDQNPFRYAITYLSDISRNLVVINQVPLFSDKQFFSSYSIIESPYDAPKSVALTEMDQRAFLAGENFSDWAKLNNIQTIDTVGLFCDTLSCSRFKDNGWLYFDVSHLSIYGAQLLAPSVGKYLLANFHNKGL